MNKSLTLEYKFVSGKPLPEFVSTEGIREDAEQRGYEIISSSDDSLVLRKPFEEGDLETLEASVPFLNNVLLAKAIQMTAKSTVFDEDSSAGAYAAKLLSMRGKQFCAMNVEETPEGHTATYSFDLAF